MLLTFLIRLNGSQNDNDLLANHFFQICVKTVNELTSNSPGVISKFEEEQVYVKKESIIFKHINGFGAILQMDNGDMTYIPLLFQDMRGFFIPFSLKKVGNKLFKLHCNDCNYEWEGSVFDFQCPKEECGSTNIVSLPNV